MTQDLVSYCYCENYEYEKVESAVNKILSAYPEMAEKVRGKKVLIKPNLLAPRHPDKAVTVHPTVIKAVVNYLKQLNCQITIADSPAGPYNAKILEKLYAACQVDIVAEETGCSLNFDTTDEIVELSGKALKKAAIIAPALEADFIINIAKLKTHSLTRLTCASKNLFGLMPGVLKYRQHLAMPDLNIFAQMLLDINSHFEGKVFHLVDGIVGMEGEGPSGGDPIFTGGLFGGWDSCLVDILACHIMGMPVNTVPTLINYRNMTINDLNINNFDEIRAYNFNLPPERSRTIPESVPEFIQNFLIEITIPKPIINKKICKKCNLCVDSCPAQIITMKADAAHIPSYKKCIRCYCCQEACPHKSIYLSKPFVERCFRIFRKKR